MISIFFSLVLGLMLFLSPYPIETALSEQTIKMIFSIPSFIFLFFTPFALMLAWLPLQKADQNQTPLILNLFKKDIYFKLIHTWLTIFSITTLLITLEPIYTHAMHYTWFFPIWVVLFSISLYLSSSFVFRILNYLNPFYVCVLFSKQAKINIINEDAKDFCYWVDSFSDIALKAIQRHSSSLVNLVIKEQQKLASILLMTFKSFSHQKEAKKVEFSGLKDFLSYALFYLYQRLDILFEKSLNNRLEPTSSLIITCFGKIAIDTAKYDITLTSIPLRFLGKCAKKAQDAGCEETTLTASCVLFEVAKEIIDHIDITYNEIKDPFLSIINGMEVLAKETFKRNKEININLLIVPFKQLRELFQSDKIKNHLDTPIILYNIDRIIGEFEALILVMNTLPKIPSVDESA